MPLWDASHREISRSIAVASSFHVHMEPRKVNIRICMTQIVTRSIFGIAGIFAGVESFQVGGKAVEFFIALHLVEHKNLSQWFNESDSCSLPVKRLPRNPAWPVMRLLLPQLNRT